MLTTTGRSTKQKWEWKIMVVMYDKLKLPIFLEGMNVPTY